MGTVWSALPVAETDSARSVNGNTRLEILVATIRCQILGSGLTATEPNDDFGWMKRGTEYVAFLRGINMIGHKTIKMERLKEIFERLGLEDVSTVQASGNVLFRAPSGGNALAERIAERLQAELGYSVDVVLRAKAAIKALVGSEPFKDFKAAPRTKFLVSFCSKRLPGVGKARPESPEKHFKIIRITAGEAFSVLTLSPNRRGASALTLLDRKFGPRITTRNWNTIKRIAASPEDRKQ